MDAHKRVMQQRKSRSSAAAVAGNLGCCRRSWYCYDTSKYIVKVLRRLIDVEKAKACASKDDPLELCSPMTKVTLVAEGQNLFDDSAEDILGGNRLGNKFHDSSKSQVLRSSSTDKERANNVAKDQSCGMLCVACFSFMLLVVCILFDANQCSFNYFRSYMLIENATCCSRFLVDNGLASANVYRF
ncbi:hypothetical protein HN51_051757 [Arachis hypogaea]